jgi:hypothetical protein
MCLLIPDDGDMPLSLPLVGMVDFPEAKWIAFIEAAD